LIAHVSTIFLLPVFEKSFIFNDLRAIAHSISAREGGNTVCWKAMARKRTVDNSVTYWFPWKHPMARLWGIEFGVLDQTPTKMGSSARSYGPRCSILFPQQNYSSQCMGSALRASPFAAMGRHPIVRSRYRYTFRALQVYQAPMFHPFDVRLAVSDMLRSTPTTPGVKE